MLRNLPIIGQLTSWYHFQNFVQKFVSTFVFYRRQKVYLFRKLRTFLTLYSVNQKRSRTLGYLLVASSSLIQWQSRCSMVLLVLQSSQATRFCPKELFVLTVVSLTSMKLRRLHLQTQQVLFIKIKKPTGMQRSAPIVTSLPRHKRNSSLTQKESYVHSFLIKLGASIRFAR